MAKKQKQVTVDLVTLARKTKGQLVSRSLSFYLLSLCWVNTKLCYICVDQKRKNFQQKLRNNFINSSQGGEGGGWMGMASCRLEFSRPENSRGSQLTKWKETTCWFCSSQSWQANSLTIVNIIWQYMSSIWVFITSNFILHW